MPPAPLTIDFIGIGAEKAGTTWLSDALRQHPEIFLPPEKELFYYNEFDFHFLTQKNPRRNWGLNWYRGKFADKNPAQICGEFSPTYLNCLTAPENIKKDFPEVKLIVALRSPVERMISQYYNDLKIGILTKNTEFQTAIRVNPAYAEKSLYGKFLENYYQIFPPRQIKVILFEDIKNRPRSVLRDLYAWLGVQSDFQPTILHQPSNPGRIGRLAGLNRLMYKTENWLNQNLPVASRLADKLGIRNLAIKIREANTKKVAKDPDLKNQLPENVMKTINNDITRLERLINQKLPAWYL